MLFALENSRTFGLVEERDGVVLLGFLAEILLPFDGNLVLGECARRNVDRVAFFNDTHFEDDFARKLVECVW